MPTRFRRGTYNRPKSLYEFLAYPALPGPRSLNLLGQLAIALYREDWRRNCSPSHILAAFSTDRCGTSRPRRTASAIVPFTSPFSASSSSRRSDRPRSAGRARPGVFAERPRPEVIDADFGADRRPPRLPGFPVIARLHAPRPRQASALTERVVEGTIDRSNRHSGKAIRNDPLFPFVERSTPVQHRPWFSLGIV